MTSPSTDQDPLHGLWCAVLTPMTRSGGIDAQRLGDHTRWLFDQGVAGVALFGTTGEGQSFSVAERKAGLESLLGQGIARERVVAATGCAALVDTIDLTRHAVAAGVPRCLVLPPFFFKEVTDDAVFACFAQVVESVGDARLRVYGYHIPQFSGVPVDAPVVARLADAYPGIMAGVKDSGGDWSHTAALLERVPRLAILVGHEPHLPKLVAAGGAGTICGVANVTPPLVQALLQPVVKPDAEQRIARFIEVLSRFPFLPAFKAMKAGQLRDPQWRAVRAPLLEMEEPQRGALVHAMKQAGFAEAVEPS